FDPNPMPAPPWQGHVEHSVPVRGRHRLRLDRMEELDLRVEDAAALADRVDGQARVVRGHLEGFPRDTRQLEGHVNPSRSHDDFRGGFTGLASLVGVRRWWAVGLLGRGADRGTAWERVNHTEKTLEHI